MNVIILSTLWGIVMMFSGFVLKREGQPTILAIVGILVLFLGCLGEVSGVEITQSTFHDMISLRAFNELFVMIILIATFFYFWLSGREVERVGNNAGEYYALIFFVLSGVSLCASYNNLLMLFLGIEIMSIPLYILTGSDKRNLKSNEASLKYFLMGSFSTGIMLLGIAFIYGDTGSFAVFAPSAHFGVELTKLSSLSTAGLLLILIALGFKVSAAPFHFWTPDVYDGAPTVFTSFMATIVKAGAFVAFLRLFVNGYGPMEPYWGTAMVVLICATLLIGNLTAVFQQSAKRMMAYSSIAQAGFMLFAIYAHNEMGTNGFLVYTAAYCLATIGIFAVLGRLEDASIEGFNGLGKRQPLLAVVATICLLSLTGIPLTGGFLGKYYMLAATVEYGGGGAFWLVIYAVLCAAVSAYYYFRLIQAMWFKEGQPQLKHPVRPAFKVGLVGLAALLILLGIRPYDLMLNWMLFF